MYFHLILKDKQTFDTIDILYATAVSVSGTNYSVTYYTDSTLASTTTSTYVFANYYIYVVPSE